MKVMGLDLSLTSTGVSIDGDTSVIAVKHQGVERLDVISTQVRLLASAKRVDFVVMEGYSFASRHSHAHSLGELGGVVKLRLYESAIPFVVVPPTTRAKFATGKGNSSKMEVLSAMSAKTGITWSGKGADDMCDAWILEQIGLFKFGLTDVDWPTSNTQVIDSVDWSGLVPNGKDSE